MVAVWAEPALPRGQGRGRGSAAARRYSGSSLTPRRATATLALGHFTLGNSLYNVRKPGARLSLSQFGPTTGRPCSSHSSPCIAEVAI